MPDLLDKIPSRFSKKLLFEVSIVVVVVGALCAGSSDLAITFRILFLGFGSVALVAICAGKFCLWTSCTERIIYRVPLFLLAFCGVISLIAGVVYCFGDGSIYHSGLKVANLSLIAVGLILCVIAILIRVRLARRL